MAAGDFSASYLADVLLKQEEIFADPRSNRELEYRGKAAMAALENQAVRFEPVQAAQPGVLQGRRSATVKAIWLKACRDNSVDLTDSNNDITDCDLSGAELESDSLTLVANEGWSESFSVLDDKSQDTFTTMEKQARGMAVAMVNLEHRINTRVISFLTANAMANLYIETSGNINGTATEWPADEWTPDLLAEFDLTAEINQIRNPYLVHGTNLRNAVYNSNFNFADDDKRNQKLKFDQWTQYWDVVNLDSTVGAKATFMVDSGALAFFTRNEYADRTPQRLKPGLHAFSIASRNLSYRDGNTLKPVMFDVYVQEGCNIATIDGMKERRPGWTYELRVRWGLSLGPEDCNNGTGILEFHNV